MFQSISHLLDLLKVKRRQDNSRQSYTLNDYHALGDLSNFISVGLLTNQSDWDIGSPNIKRSDNISIVASNTIDKSTFRLQLKWRPNSSLGIVTLLSHLSLQIDARNLIYNDISSYRPTRSTVNPDRIVQYGANGSCLKLLIISPFRKYRLVFRGHMKSAGEATSHFVRLNLWIIQTSRVFNFQKEAENVASSKFCCDDRFEQTVRLIGEYSIKNSNSSDKEVGKLHLWGFHTKQLLDLTSSDLKVNSEIFGMFKNGRAFHLSYLDYFDQKSEQKRHVEYGYACFRIGPGVESTQNHGKQGGTLIDWKQISSETSNVAFTVASQDMKFEIEAIRRSTSSRFVDMILDSKIQGWGLVDKVDALEEEMILLSINTSIKEWQSNFESCSSAFEFYKSGPSELSPLVVSISDRECLDASLVGAKASSLAQLKSYSSNNRIVPRGHYIVPSAVVLTKFAYQKILEENPSLSDPIHKLIDALGRGNISNLDSECKRLVNLFKSDAKLPEQVISELKQQVSSYLDFEVPNVPGDARDSPSLIVRSSSWGEDEEDMSAAGQLTSVLSVRGFDKLLGAVMECFASKFSFQNVEYKRQRGLPVDSPMAVIVQEQIGCDKAGVMFTCDPVSGDPRRVLITANYGLGESVVSARTDPDSIKVRVLSSKSRVKGSECIEPSLEIEEIKIGEKNNIITEADMTSVDRSKCCLANDETIGLAQCGLKLADYFQQPCDIEWGWKNGLLYLFQSRPITGLDSCSEFELLHEADETTRAEVDYITRCNVNEVLPYAMTPMFLSLMGKIYKLNSFEILLRLGKVSENDYSLDCNTQFIYYVYHIFLGLRSDGIFDFGGEKSLIARSMEIAIFGHEVDDKELAEASKDMKPPIAGDRFEDLRFNLTFWKLRYFPYAKIAQNKKNNKRLRHRIRSMKFSEGSETPAALYQQVKALIGFARESLTNHFIASQTSSRVNLDLLSLLSKYIDEPSQLFAAFSTILAASPDVLSGEIPRRVERIAKLIAVREAKEAESFVGLSSSDALDYLSSATKGQLAEEFDAFMAKFGHRSYNEFELAHRPWRETPDIIVEMIKANVTRYLEDPKKLEEKPEEVKGLDFAIESSGIQFSHYDRFRLKYRVGPECHKFVAAREETKNLLIDFNDIVREACRMLAVGLRKACRIPDDDLFYYLYLQEVEPLIKEPQPSIVVLASRRRKMFKKMFKRNWRFSEIERIEKELLPHHLKETSSAIANDAEKLFGVTASSGKVRGRVCLVSCYEELHKVKANDIMVTFCTDIAFAPVFPIIAGVITEVGGLISHGAVVAREYGLPSVIGIKNVTKLLKHGEQILLDADNGVIIRSLNEDENN